MLLTFFAAMLDNMWKVSWGRVAICIQGEVCMRARAQARFMAAMMIILHANGVYCPWAYTIYANWECRGVASDEWQICDVGETRGAPLDPAGLYKKFGCEDGERLVRQTTRFSCAYNRVLDTR
eukprot:SAG11_NODE_13549_length_650_cov_1.063521_1_plen_123_part_00